MSKVHVLILLLVATTQSLSSAEDGSEMGLKTGGSRTSKSSNNSFRMIQPEVFVSFFHKGKQICAGVKVRTNVALTLGSCFFRCTNGKLEPSYRRISNIKVVINDHFGRKVYETRVKSVIAEKSILCSAPNKVDHGRDVAVALFEDDFGLGEFLISDGTTKVYDILNMKFLESTVELQAVFSRKCPDLRSPDHYCMRISKDFCHVNGLEETKYMGAGIYDDGLQVVGIWTGPMINNCESDSYRGVVRVDHNTGIIEDYIKKLERENPGMIF